MPGPLALLNIVVTANTTAANANLAKTQAQLKSTAATANASTTATSKSASKWGTALAAAGRTGALALGVAGAASVKMALDFEDSMKRVQFLVGVSEKQTKQWGDALLSMAGRVGKSPKELAEALYFVASSGIKVNKVLSTTETAAKASALGLGETQVVADALTSAMNAYAKSGLTAEQATNVLIQTVKLGKLEADSLAQSIGRVIPVASKLGVPFHDVGASLASLSLQGLDAAESTTALRAVFLAVLKPGSQASEQLATVGLSADKLRGVLKEKGTLAMLQLLSSRFKGNEEAMARVFPNVRGLVGAFSLTGDSAKRNAEIQKEMAKQTDELGAAWDQFTKGPGQRLRMGWAFIQAQMVRVGIVILDVANSKIPQMVSALRDFWKQSTLLRVAFGVIGAVVQHTASVVGQVLQGMAQTVRGVVEVVSGVLTLRFGRAWRGVKDIFSGGVKAILGNLRGLLGPIGAIAGKLGHALSAPFGIALKAITGFIDAIISVINTVLGPVGVHIGSVGGRTPATSADVGATPKGRAHGRAGKKHKNATGGLAGVVPGAGSGDKVLMQAMVEPNEGVFIMNKNAMGVLQAVNDSIPRFARGGMSSVTPGKPGAVTSNVGPNLNPASWNLPGVGGLPQWIQPAGEFVLDKVGDFIKKKLASAVTGVGGDILLRGAGAQAKSKTLQGMGLQAGISNIAAAVLTQFPGLSVSSALRPGDSGSFHSSGRAIDLSSGNYKMMNTAAGWIAANMTGLLTEGIHNPNLSVKYGKAVSPSFWGAGTWAQHLNHIHLAKQRGGQIFGSRLNVDQLTTLAKYVGMKSPALMAAIAMAESSGNPSARGGAGEYGLWQIMPFWGGGASLLDPIKNARKAKYILGKQGLTAWTMYKNGGYRRFLGGHVKPGLLAALRGNTTAAKGATSKGMSDTTFGFGPLTPGSAESIEGNAAVLQELIDATEGRRSAMIDLLSAANMEALQRYQVGMAQNPLLGIPTPNMPTLASTNLPSARDMYLQSLGIPLGGPPYYPSGKTGAGAGMTFKGEPIHGGLTHHTHVHVDGKEIAHVVEKLNRRNSRRGNRPLPGARGR